MCAPFTSLFEMVDGHIKETEDVQVIKNTKIVMSARREAEGGEGRREGVGGGRRWSRRL